MRNGKAGEPCMRPFKLQKKQLEELFTKWVKVELETHFFYPVTSDKLECHLIQNLCKDCVIIGLFHVYIAKNLDLEISS